MDRFMSCNIEQQSIYEIYRACRLCGAGAGYKMPIIQNVVDLDGREVELKQKIQECVQIQVHQSDKMPPLICELCVDKVNDFYEFLEMCRQTNKRTRLRLGLPPQRLPNGAPDAGDCILGVTEPVYLNDSDSNEPISKQINKPYKGKSKPKVKIQLPAIRRESRSRQPSPPSFKRTTRGSTSSPQITITKLKSNNETRNTDVADISRHQNKSSTPLKSILKKGKPLKVEEESLLIPRSKRSREKETIKELQPKRVKIEVKPTAKSAPKSTKLLQPQQNSFTCKICARSFQSNHSLSNHSRIHNFNHDAKVKNKQPVARRSTPAEKQKDARKETAPDTSSRYVKCSECGASITRWNLKRHKTKCRKSTDYKDVTVDPEVRASLRQVQVRVARCDSLLTAQDSCTTYNIPQEYGLDTACVYPYISSVRSLRIKTEPNADGMVNIDDRIRDVFGCNEVFVHWDSDDSSEVSSVCSSPTRKRKVDSLTALTLKTIFSSKCLGKVPRRHRRVKTENLRDNENDSSNLIESFEDIDDLERMNDRINERIASFDDLLRGDDFSENLPDTANEDTGDNLEKERSDDNEECSMESVSIDTDTGMAVEQQSLDTGSKHNEDRVEEVDDNSDRQVKVNNKEPASKPGSCSDSERRNKSETHKYNHNNFEENVSVLTININLDTNLENNLLNDKTGAQITENEEVENSTTEHIINPELNSETAESTEADEVIEPEINTEIKRNEVNTNNIDVQLLNKDDLSGSLHENLKGEQRGETENVTKEGRSDEEIDQRSNECEEETIKSYCRELNESIDIDNDNNREANVNFITETRRTEETDAVQESGGDESNNQYGVVTENGAVEHKNASASVNVNELKDISANRQDTYKLNIDDLDYISDTELDDCKLMEALDEQIGEKSGGDKDKVTLEDLLPDKSHEIKPIDMEMLTDQFSFDA